VGGQCPPESFWASASMRARVGERQEARRRRICHRLRTSRGLCAAQGGCSCSSWTTSGAGERMRARCCHQTDRGSARQPLASLVKAPGSVATRRSYTGKTSADSATDSELGRALLRQSGPTDTPYYRVLDKLKAQARRDSLAQRRRFPGEPNSIWLEALAGTVCLELCPFRSVCLRAAVAWP
jgi:hypothetical protein